MCCGAYLALSLGAWADSNSSCSNRHPDTRLAFSAWHCTRRSLSLNHRLSELKGASHYHGPSRGPQCLSAAQGHGIIMVLLGHSSGLRPG